MEDLPPSRKVPDSNQTNRDYEFTKSWFDDTARAVWDKLMPQLKPSKVVEIGSFEGASAVYMIEANDWSDRLDFWAIDTWEGGVEHRHDEIDMVKVEERFDRNIAVARAKVPATVTVTKRKGRSDMELSKLIVERHSGTFDFVYVDGSHMATDVLIDAVLAFKLCRVGGVIAFDDYLWARDPTDPRDPVRSPKFAIDAFTNVFCRKVQLMPAPLYQVYAHKMAD